MAVRALKGLTGFAKALKVKYADIEVGFDYEPEPGLADNGDLEHDLQALLEVVGAAAQKADTALVLFIDELQYVKEEELAVLITALHRAAQRRLPVLLVGAGLPQLRGRMGKAKSYAERLFDFPAIGPLPPPAAKIAIVKPAEDQGVKVNEDALKKIIKKLMATPTSSRSGENMPGTRRSHRLSPSRTLSRRQKQRSRHLTKASSGSGSTALHPLRKNTCEPWQNWALGPIAQATLRKISIGQ